jgi:hypothetical protein
MTERVKRLVAGTGALTKLCHSHLLGFIEPELIASMGALSVDRRRSALQRGRRHRRSGDFWGWLGGQIRLQLESATLG